MDKLPVYIAKRYLLLLAGLSIMAFGVAFSIKASLGTSPISSVPYVVSLFAPLTVGTATIVMHCVAAVDCLSHRNSAGGSGRQPGSEGRSSCAGDLQSASENQIRVYESRV